MEDGEDMATHIKLLQGKVEASPEAQNKDVDKILACFLGALIHEHQKNDIENQIASQAEGFSDHALNSSLLKLKGSG